MRARGQSLIITVMIMLVVVIMVFFTFSVGDRTRKKMRMQALADSTAYSSAVAEARAMNFFALTNRAIISNMVSTLSVSAHNSWMTWYEDMLMGAVQNWWNMAGALHDRGRTDPGCIPCQARLTQAARTAFDIAEWYAFAMPRYGTGHAHRGGITLPGLPEPWPPFTNHPFPNRVWEMNGGNPRRVPFAAWNPVSSPDKDDADRIDLGCYNLRTPAGTTPRPIGRSGVGERGDCEARLARVRGVRGAYWVHRQFHAKVDGDWCSMMQMARRQHFDNAIITRAMQLNVQRELVYLLRGEAPSRPEILDRPLVLDEVRQWLYDVDSNHLDVDATPAEKGESGSGGTIDFYDARNQTGPNVIPTPLVDRLAQKVDPDVRATIESRRLTSRLFMNAIVPQYAPGARPGADPNPDGPARAMSHRDFDQMEFVTRYPQWVFQRRVDGFSDHLLREENWRNLQAGARAIAAAGSSGQLDNYAWYGGNAKAMSVRDLPLPQTNTRRNTSGMNVYAPAANEMVNENVWWLERALTGPGDVDPAYVEGTTGTPVVSWYTWRPVQGASFVGELEDESFDKVFGRNFGHGAYDHGRVISEFFVGGACGQCGRVEGRQTQWKERNGGWQKGDGEPPKGIHFFHGEAPSVGHRQGAINQSTDHQYVGHMRFAATAQPDDLWNMPRTVVMLTRPSLDRDVSFQGEQGRRPWDFEMSAPIFGDLSLTTLTSRGDARADNQMAAAASGLVYYHQPTRWEEPPNLWNPFWRAKLHPLRRDQLLQAGHAPTTRALSALPAAVVNE
ncbi:MAG: Tad domain-containing protein [Myxococcaceae bacterium]|nr:Tad domain-containing protein [Myxococcaceae bacterium]